MNRIRRFIDHTDPKTVELFVVATAGFIVAVIAVVAMLIISHHGHPAPDHHAAPAPAVTVVTLANGAKVNCVTEGAAISCDWAGWAK